MLHKDPPEYDSDKGESNPEPAPNSIKRQKQHKPRREKIMAYATESKEVPLRIENVLERLANDLDPAEYKVERATVLKDFDVLVRDQKLVKVGKARGRYCGWALPEYESAAGSYLKREEKQSAQGDATLSIPRTRRSKLTSFATEEVCLCDSNTRSCVYCIDPLPP